MAIKGDLTSIDLTQVFQMMSLNQKEGRLILDRGIAAKISVLFCRHGLTMLPILDLTDEDTLIYVLKRRNIAGGDLIEARKKYERPGKPLIEALKEYGLIERGWVLDVLRERIQAQLLDLFFLTSAHFEFREESTEKYIAGLDDEERSTFFFTVEEVIMEGTHRLDEWHTIRQFVSSNDEIFCQRYLPERVGDDGMRPEMAEVLMALNGIRDVNEVVQLTGLGNFRVCSYLAELLRDGFIEPVDSEELKESATNLFQSGRLREALRLFHRVLDVYGKEAEILLRTALIYERLGEPLNAVQHYRQLADQYLADGAIVQCYEYYQTCRRLIPTDTDILGRLIGLYLRYHDAYDLSSFDPVDGSRELVQIYIEMGDNDKAIDLLQRLVRSEIDARQNRNQLIELLLSNQRNKEAVAELEQVGKKMIRDGDRQGAARVYRQILRLAPERKDISRILDEVDQERKEKKRRRRRRFGVARSGVYLSLFVGLYWYYDQMATRELKALDVRPLIHAKRFDTASRRLQEFVDRFPFSRAAMDARTHKQSILNQSENYRRALKNHEEVRATEFVKGLGLAKTAHAESLRLIEGGNFDGALEKLRQADTFSVGHDEWRKSVNLEANLDDLSKRVGEAAVLRRKSDEALADGDQPAAFRFLREAFDRFPDTVKSKRWRIPILITTEPPGATVTIDGVELPGETPLVAPLLIGRDTKVECDRKGYAAAAQMVRAEMKSTRVFVLPKRPIFAIQTKQRLGGTPVLRFDRLIVGGRDGRVVAVDLQNEAVLWRQRFQGLNDNFTSPIIVGQGVVTGSVEAGLFCLGHEDGHRQWTALAKDGGFFPNRPVVVGDRVIAAGSKGLIFAVNTSSGLEMWRREIAGSPRAGLAEFDGMLLAGNNESTIYAIDVESGRIRVRKSLRGNLSGQPLLHEGRLYVSTDEGSVSCRDPQTLEPKWTTNLGKPIRAPLRAVDGWLYVALEKGVLTRLALQDGLKDSITYAAEGPLLGAPIVRGREIYVGVGDGSLVVLDVNTMAERWRVRLDSAVQGTLVEWDGKIIAATLNGTIYGFE